MAKIDLFKVYMGTGVDRAVLDVLHSGYVTQGTVVDDFERALEPVAGTNRIVSLNSGTSALTLALRLADVEPGDEVITTPMTCIATNVPIATAGAKIKWADVDPITGLIDPVDVAKIMTPQTKAIVAVDWGGLPCNYDELVRLGVPVIADAAHSLGSTYKGRKVGTLADFTAFSFQAIKTLTTVDGGALTTQYDYDHKRAKLLRWFGVDRENNTAFRGELDVPEAGYKFHMNNLNAAIGLANIKYIDAILAEQKVGGWAYKTALPDDIYTIPELPYESDSAHWLYTVLLPGAKDRDTFIKYMAENEIEVSRVHWRNDAHTAFKKFQERTLPGVDAYSDRMVCIPNHYALSMTDRDKIVRTMSGFREWMVG